MKNFNRDKTGYILAGALSGVGCMIMVAFPAIALNATEKGVSLWASSVLPALLPFFICANFMTAVGLPALIGRLFERPFRKIFGAPGISAFVFSISITSGYPMGAKLIGDMGRKHEITKGEAKRMLTFCSTSGPLFMLGAVGAGMLCSPAAGAVIAIAHYLGAILNGIVFRIFSMVKNYIFHRTIHKGKGMVIESKSIERNHLIKLPKGSILDIFTDSIISSFKALAIICGYIVLFTLATDFLQFSGLLNLVDSNETKGVIKGFFEMTIGCNSISIIPQLDLMTKCIVCTAIISWGGLSILAQSMSMLSGLGISPWYYIWTKLMHSFLSGMVALLIAPSILSMQAVSSGMFGTEVLTEKLGSVYGLLFSTKMVIMVLVIFLLLIVVDSKIQKYKKQRSLHEDTGNHS